MDITMSSVPKQMLNCLRNAKFSKFVNLTWSNDHITRYALGIWTNV